MQFHGEFVLAVGIAVLRVAAVATAGSKQFQVHYACVPHLFNPSRSDRL